MPSQRRNLMPNNSCACSPCGGCLLEQLRGQNRAFGLHLRVEQVAELVGDILAVTNDSSRLID